MIIIPNAMQEELRQRWCKHERVKDLPYRAKCPECGLWIEIFGERAPVKKEKRPA